MQTWTYPDTHPTTPGPWADEPDKMQWIDEATGLDCLIVRNHNGALCGYVGVPAGHPAHGKDWDDVDVDVHGGLTYAAPCQEDGKICHVPEPGQPDDVWWLGFDCGHHMDLSPKLRELLPPNLRRPYLGEVYRDVAYVRSEVTSLARQLAAQDAQDASS